MTGLPASALFGERKGLPRACSSHRLARSPQVRPRNSKQPDFPRHFLIGERLCRAGYHGPALPARDRPCGACGLAVKGIVSKKRPRITIRASRLEPAYWRSRLFKNTFTYRGRRVEIRGWSVKIQLFGKRKTFSLSSRIPLRAAEEACQIYQLILAEGWERIVEHSATKSPTSVMKRANYWRQRLIHRNYPGQEAADSIAALAVRIEHARIGHYFPLGTADEFEAAHRAMRIYSTVVNQGWACVNSRFPRELALALRWQDCPLAWTYTNIHTCPTGHAPMPVRDHARTSPERRVTFIEPDVGIRRALAACANGQDGFRCDMTFADSVEAAREIVRHRVELVLGNQDLFASSDGKSVDELQRANPRAVVLSYSVFDDADQLFKSTPGGSVGYMLKRTHPNRLFEPIAALAGPVTRERIASQVRGYFQHLATLLPSGSTSREVANLTAREHQVLALMSVGLLAKEIAERLQISFWTVQGHVKRIFWKLHVHTRTEAVVKYLRK